MAVWWFLGVGVVDCPETWPDSRFNLTFLYVQAILPTKRWHLSFPSLCCLLGPIVHNKVVPCDFQASAQWLPFFPLRTNCDTKKFDHPAGERGHWKIAGPWILLGREGSSYVTVNTSWGAFLAPVKPPQQRLAAPKSPPQVAESYAHKWLCIFAFKVWGGLLCGNNNLKQKDNVFTE